MLESDLAGLAFRAHQRALVPRTRRAVVVADTVLITGGSGYFGTVLTEQALAAEQYSQLYAELYGLQARAYR